MKRAFLFFTAFFLLLISGRAHACTVSATPIRFGTYDVFRTIPTDTRGLIRIRCPFKKKRKVIIAIGPSTVSGSFNPRQMKLLTGTDRLDYNIFTNRAMTKIWGDGTGGTKVVKKKVGRKKAKKVKVFARIPALQNVSIGSYADTVTVTIVW